MGEKGLSSAWLWSWEDALGGWHCGQVHQPSPRRPLPVIPRHPDWPDAPTQAPPAGCGKVTKWGWRSDLWWPALVLRACRREGFWGVGLPASGVPWCSSSSCLAPSWMLQTRWWSFRFRGRCCPLSTFVYSFQSQLSSCAQFMSNLRD